MSKRFLLFLLLLTFLAALVGCGRNKGPTPVPTLGNATVIPLTPTPGPSVPAIPKYLPTPVATRAAPTQPAAEKPVSPTEVLTIGVTPTSREARVVVVVSEAYAYNGPGEAFVPIGVARAGAQLVIEERSPDGKWLHACCFAGRPGWIALKDVRPLTDLNQVPVATSVPAAPGTSPLATPTPGG